MGSVDRVDDRTFKANYTGDGATKLRENVNEKLKEFMGDYTDDTLVDYVIVLLRNGRNKEEAKNELNVFLGDDDSQSFVSWLWDHLSSNFDLYIQPQESVVEGGDKPKLTSGDHGGRNDSYHLDSETEMKSNRVSRSRHNREWKGLVRDADEPPPLRSSALRSSEIVNVSKEKTYDKVSRMKRSLSPQAKIHKKRSRPDERNKKEDAVSKLTNGASRRLLQFAVRDAVSTSSQSNSSTGPRLKRLRSVVSTPHGESSLVQHPRRLQSVARVPNPMASMIKAVAEAAEDVKKGRSSGNVFDRLGHDMDVSHPIGQLAGSTETASKAADFKFFDRERTHSQSTYHQKRNYTGEFVKETTMLENATGLAYDSTSENEDYDEVNGMGGRVTDNSHIGTSDGNEVNDSMSVQYNVAKNSDDLCIAQKKYQELPVSSSNASRKIVNISVNVNTWKPPHHYQGLREVADVNDQISVQGRELGAVKSAARSINENNKALIVDHGKISSAGDNHKTVIPTQGLYSGGRAPEDADSRTIFVNNVHFAATKDSISQHFNKFGEVAKVVIVTDATTGHPKGSAYIEFAQKEAADNALSFNGTSFMSRILKVTKRSSTHQEAAPTMAWPRIARGSSFAVARFAGAPFRRAVPMGFRPRLQLKPGARSMQWKRDAQVSLSPAEAGVPASANFVPSPAARSLTYVRTEPKANNNSGTA